MWRSREYETKIKEMDLPELAMKEAERELSRLSRMHPSSAEYTVAATYLDWITSLPWHAATEDNLDINAARKVLDDDHFGLEKPKKRILEIPGRAEAQARFQRAHHLFCRTSRHGENLPGPVHSPGSGPEFRADFPGRGPG